MAEDWLGKNSARLIDAAAMTLPMGIITAISNSLQKSALASPWTIVWVGLPLGIAIVLTLRFIRREHAPLAHWRWALLFAVFCSLFAVFSVSDLLRWRAVTNPDDAVVARGWMLPVRAGDWHYWFARRVPLDPAALVVVMLERPPGTTTEALRRREAELLRLVPQAEGVIGVALDVYFVDATAADAELCAAIDGAGAPVISGYTRQYVGTTGEYIELPDKPPLACQPQAKQGHLLGFADADGRVRAVQPWFRSSGDQPALSQKIAALIRTRFNRPDVPLRDDDVLHYLPPANEIREFTLAQVSATPGLLNNKFLLVGIDTAIDRPATPFGELAGTMIHAYAVHSLLTGSIARPPALWSIASIFAACYALLFCAVRRRSTLFLVASAVAISVLVVATAAVSMFVWNVWLEVVYCLTAAWLWLGILLVARRWLARPPRLAIDPR